MRDQGDYLQDLSVTHICKYNIKIDLKDQNEWTVQDTFGSE